MENNMKFQNSSPYMTGSTATASSSVPTLVLAEAKKEQTEKPKAGNRCTACPKKLGLTDMNCRCGHRFCATHRIPEAHACSYDYRAAAAALLTAQLPRVVGDKIERI